MRGSNRRCLAALVALIPWTLVGFACRPDLEIPNTGTLDFNMVVFPPPGEVVVEDGEPEEPDGGTGAPDDGALEEDDERVCGPIVISVSIDHEIDEREWESYRPPGLEREVEVDNGIALDSDRCLYSHSVQGVRGGTNWIHLRVHVRATDERIVKSCLIPRVLLAEQDLYWELGPGNDRCACKGDRESLGYDSEWDCPREGGLEL